VRTNQPKVYVISGLAGGTGGGMFLDTAYVIREHFREARYEKPEIIGAFLLPTAERQAKRTLALGNTFAALTELNHFSTPGTAFTARYEEKEKPLSLKHAPFDRCLLVEAALAKDETCVGDGIAASAELIRRELTTSLGRMTEQCRGDALAAEQTSAQVRCQVFGLHRIAWPKRALTRTAAARLCRQLVARWITKDALPVKEPVQASLGEFWSKNKLDGEELLNRLQTASEQAVEKSMDEAFSEATAPLAGIETKSAAEQFACLGATLDAIEQLLGRGDGSAGVRQGQIAEPLGSVSDLLIGKWAQKLTGWVFSLLEEPRYRLAGAEEAVRQVTSFIEETLVHHEGLAKELSNRAEEAHQKIIHLLANMHTAPQANRPPEVLLARIVELLSAYPRWRFQSLVLQRVTAIFVSLRGRLSDQLREINYCRTRLVELQRGFEKIGAASRGGEKSSGGLQIFPAGCRTLADAANMLSEAVAQSQLHEVDARIQKLICENFLGLAHVCLSSSNMLDAVQSTMRKEAETFIDARLSTFDLAEMYLAHVGGETQAEDDLATAFDEAAPPFTGAGSAQHARINILAVPGGAIGERIVDIARKALPDVELKTAAGGNEIVFYREISQLPLAGLEQLGPLAYEAYTQISSVEHFTPHSRTDILEWRAATAS
jgi:hypothetical protein